MFAIDVQSLLVFAQNQGKTYWSQISDSTRQAASFITIVLFLFLLAMGATLIVVAWRFREREQRDLQLNSHPELFEELCEAHQLSADERSLIQELARLAGSDHADLLFVRGDLFVTGADSWTAEQGSESGARAEELYRKLFQPSEVSAAGEA